MIIFEEKVDKTLNHFKHAWLEKILQFIRDATSRGVAGERATWTTISFIHLPFVLSIMKLS